MAMLLEFLASIIAGLGVIGILIALNRLTGRRMPKWAFPAGFAATMIGYTVWSEYTWPDRAVVAELGYVEASRNATSAWYKPWTLIWPQSNRVIAIDHRHSRQHPDHPGLVMTRVALLARWTPELGYMVAFDCVNHASAELFDGVTVAEDGSLEGAVWVQMEETDSVLRAACRMEGG
jgi:hypothetical protein